MEYTQAMSEIQEREGREAQAQENDEKERKEIDFRPLWERDVNYLVCSPNERRKVGDDVADFQDWILGGVSHNVFSREVPNGPDDVDEEVEDEYEITEETF